MYAFSTFLSESLLTKPVISECSNLYLLYFSFSILFLWCFPPKLAKTNFCKIRIVSEVQTRAQLYKRM